MDADMIKRLAHELAVIVNSKVDIPLVPEDLEEEFYEIVIRAILSLFLKKL